MDRELTDLERDLGSGPVPKPIMFAAVGRLSEESEDVLAQRYDNGVRVMLAGEMSVERGWNANETGEKIRKALAELNGHIRELTNRG